MLGTISRTPFRETLYHFGRLFFAEAPCRSMLLSIFSHRSFAHIFASMFALYNFTDGISYALGKEQMVFLYVTAGMFANYVCYMRTVVRGISAPPCGAVSYIFISF